MKTFPHLIFLHGLNSSSQAFKAKLLQAQFPDIQVPDFAGDLATRMAALEPILSHRHDWIIIGSSFGGLMGALYTCTHPDRVQKLILLAPALIWPEFAKAPPDPVGVPTVVIHGLQDKIIPLDIVRPLAQKVFTHLDFRVVADDHGLHKTAQTLDWAALCSIGH